MGWNGWLADGSERWIPNSATLRSCASMIACNGIAIGFCEVARYPNKVEGRE